MKFLALNQLLAFTEDGHTERVLWFDAEDAGYVCIDIHVEHANPIYRRHVELISLMEERAVQPRVDDPFLMAVSDDRLSPAQRATRDRSYARIAPLLDRQPEIFELRKRGQIIAEAVATRGESRHSLLRRDGNAPPRESRAAAPLRTPSHLRTSPQKGGRSSRQLSPNITA